MTLNEVLREAYGWADGNAAALLITAAALPVVGTVLAWLGKKGQTDADGRFLASLFLGVGLFAVVLEVAAASVAHMVLGVSLLDANALLLLAPVVCLAGCVVGIRKVFPLSELGSVQSAVDLGTFALAMAGVVWVFSRFRGWGVVFFGGVGQLVVLGVLTFFLLRRLYGRAFGVESRR